MGQHANPEHDSNMEQASRHRAYMSHDGKKNAPLPFNHLSPVGEADDQEAGSDAAGKHNAPAPFNQQHGKPIPVKGKELSKGKTG